MEFGGLPDGGIDPITDAWRDYAEHSFDAVVVEDEDGSADEQTAGRKKRGRTEVTHARNGIPYLPDIRELSLDQAKALVREFLTGYYSKPTSSLIGNY